MSDKPSLPVPHYARLPFDDIETMFHRMDARLTKIEAAIIRLETERAVNEEKQKFMEGRFNQIDSKLMRIDGHISKLVWLIIAAILGAFMSFIMQGAIFNV